MTAVASWITMFGACACVMLVLPGQVALLSTLMHPNIVRYVGTQRDATSLYIFLEYVPVRQPLPFCAVAPMPPHRATGPASSALVPLQLQPAGKHSSHPYMD